MAYTWMDCLPSNKRTIANFRSEEPISFNIKVNMIKLKGIIRGIRSKNII